MTHHQEPLNPTEHIPDPLLASHVTSAQATALTESVNKLHRDVHGRSVGFLIALILTVIVGAAVAVIGYRSEHFLTCQVQQNSEFRNAAATERAAQRRLFDTILDPARSQADRLKATQDYYAGLIAADQQRGTATAGAC